MASGAMSGVPIVVKGGKPSNPEPQAITHTAQTVAGYESFDSKSIMSWHVIRHGK